MATMSVEDRVKDFIKKVGPYGGTLSDYYCGMTNNVVRRSKEHGIENVICRTHCDSKKTARNLMTQLQNAGFDVDPDIMSGQDDSVNVYVYKKTGLTKQQLVRTVTIDFQEVWYSEEYLDKLPQTNGIYCCYSCDRALQMDHFQNSKPLYIGMAAHGFKDRINRHKTDDHDRWKKNQKMGADKQLVYAIAEFDNEILQTVESALICENRPPENTEYIDGYQGEYHTINVNCTGCCCGLKPSVTATFAGK